jgi:hypothetical protein
MLKSFVGGATNSGNSKIPIDFTRSGARQLNAPPISTKNGFQSTAGYDNKGLPGDLTTHLGAYRQGDGGAIAEGQIFPDLPVYHATGTAVMFNKIGNNVFQPDNNDNATHALLSRLGDQRFKAVWNLPHENYFQEQKLQKEMLDIERTASGSEMNLSREIMRNVVATRRQQTEDDYRRRAIDSGMSAEDAEMELQMAKQNNAKHEAEALPDRPHQHKILLSRIAMSKGITPNIQPSLDRSHHIMNHKPSQAMAEAMGNPGTGFGSSELDLARKFMTPEFYRRFLRRSALTPEEADRQTALSQVFSEQPDNDEALDSYSTMHALEREEAIESHRENMAARLELLRNRGRRVMGIVPAFVVFPEIMRHLLPGKQPGQKIRFRDENIDGMTRAQLIVALNVALTNTPSAVRDLNRQLLSVYNAGSVTDKDLSSAVKMIQGELNMGIPIVNASSAHPAIRELFRKEFDAFKTSNSAQLSEMEKSAKRINLIIIGEPMALTEEDFAGEEGLGTQMGTGEPVPSRPPTTRNQGDRSATLRAPRGQTRSLRSSSATRGGGAADRGMGEIAPSGGGGAGNTVGTPHVVNPRTGIRMQDVPLPGSGYPYFVGAGKGYNKYKPNPETSQYDPVTDFNADGLLIPDSRLGQANSRYKFLNLLQKNKEAENIQNARMLRQNRNQALASHIHERASKIRSEKMTSKAAETAEHARTQEVTHTAAPAPRPAPTHAEADKKPPSKLNKAELMDRARRQGITVPPGAKNKDIVKLIKDKTS